MIPVKIFINGVQAATGNIDLSVVGSTQTVASAGGNVTATLTANWDATMASGYYRIYSFAATAANQYQFARWKWTERIYTEGSPNYDPEVVYTNNTTPTQAYDSDGYTRDSAGNLRRMWIITEIEAYFTGSGPTPAHTHLLVNSFNRSTPVRLVYDPTTNKLVADC